METATEKSIYQELSQNDTMYKPSSDMADHPLAMRTSTTSGKVVRYIKTIGSSSITIAIFNQAASYAEQVCKRYNAPNWEKYISYFHHFVNITALLFITTRWIWGKISKRREQRVTQN
ncbi:hypothetical protein BDW74DRAFT_159045 [Aspergillus multicolor]|uniref:uncharacterized protein n=1 Tax=Aspergillus multicolor TaxID=41759 RepID=UPI003CCD5CC4